MPHPWSRRRVKSAAAVLIAALAVLTLGSAVARADVFPMNESFQGSAFTAPNWHTGGSAFLTASNGTDTAGNGWLRLTSASTTQFGYAIDDTAFPSSNGILVDFDYATYGGTGADGLSFFLYDGSTPFDGTFHVGAAGGSLGYAPCSTNTGVPNAYIGVGFDEFGNFTNLSSCGLDGSTARRRSPTRSACAVPRPTASSCSGRASRPRSR